MEFSAEVLGVLEDYGIFEGQLFTGDENGLPASERCYLSRNYLVILSQDVPEPKQNGFLYRMGFSEAELEYRDENITIYLMLDDDDRNDDRIVDFFNVDEFHKEEAQEAGNKLPLEAIKLDP